MKAAIDLLVRGQELPAELMREVMLSLMRGEADPAAVGAFCWLIRSAPVAMAPVFLMFRRRRRLSLLPAG